MKKSTALLLNLGAVFCWVLSPLVIRFLTSYYPALVQTFFRYLASLLVIWPFFLLTNSTETVRQNLRRIPRLLPRLLLIAGANFCFQVGFTYAFYLLYPGLATLVNQSGLLFSILLATLIFPDERRSLRFSADYCCWCPGR